MNEEGKALEDLQNESVAVTNGHLPLAPDSNEHPLSKNARKKLLKLQRYEAKKAHKKAMIKEKKQIDAERKKQEWAEKLAAVSEEEKSKLIESRKELRKERMDVRNQERDKKRDKLRKSMEIGQNIVIDLEFSDLMTASEINSLVQQISYCYSVNGRCASPGHLWLTGCRGEIQTQLQRSPGFDKWIIEKENRSYLEALQDKKENLVYLTADAETVLEELDPSMIYIIGGLVDRNRWKGLTLKKAKEQGIRAAKLPIANYLKMSSSQVLTVNHVVEILLRFLETRDWGTSFFQVIPQRKRCEVEEDDVERKRKCTVESSKESGGTMHRYMESPQTGRSTKLEIALLWRVHGAGHTCTRCSTSARTISMPGPFQSIQRAPSEVKIQISLIPWAGRPPSMSSHPSPTREITRPPAPLLSGKFGVFASRWVPTGRPLDPGRLPLELGRPPLPLPYLGV